MTFGTKHPNLVVMLRGHCVTWCSINSQSHYAHLGSVQMKLTNCCESKYYFFFKYKVLKILKLKIEFSAFKTLVLSRHYQIQY